MLIYAAAESGCDIGGQYPASPADSACDVGLGLNFAAGDELPNEHASKEITTTTHAASSGEPRIESTQDLSLAPAVSFVTKSVLLATGVPILS